VVTRGPILKPRSIVASALAIGGAIIGSNVTASEPSGQAPPVITNPRVLTAPTEAQLASVYPERAARNQTPGKARISCAVSKAGELHDCRVLDEAPRGNGFGNAALKLAGWFRMAPEMIDGEPVDGGTYTTAMEFKPSPWESRTLRAPTVFPTNNPPIDCGGVGAESSVLPMGGRIAGYAAIVCEFTPNGVVLRCTWTSENPEGFGEAAARLACLDKPRVRASDPASANRFFSDETYYHPN
jgi:TonB family protein